MLSSQQSLLKLLQQERCIVTSKTVDQPVAGSTVYFFEKETGATSGNYRRQVPHVCFQNDRCAACRRTLSGQQRDPQIPARTVDGGAV